MIRYPETLVTLSTLFVLCTSVPAHAQAPTPEAPADEVDVPPPTTQELQSKSKRNATYKAISGFFIVVGGAATTAGAALAIPPWIQTMTCDPGPRVSCGGMGSSLAIGFGSLFAGVGVPVLGISIPSWIVANRNQKIAERQLEERKSSANQFRWHITPAPGGTTLGFSLRF